MEAFLIYGVKSGLLLALFWTVYRFFLRRETFYRFNRLFLLGGLATALLLPLTPVRYTVVKEVPATGFAEIPLTTGAVAGEADGSFPGDAAGMLLYAAGAALFAGVRFRGLWRLRQEVRRCGSRPFGGYRLVESVAFRESFSYWRYIFLPRSGLSRQEREMILKHETAHVGQRHWADLWLADAVCLLWWLNPFVWLYKRSICENHEFLADRAVLADYPAADYQSALLNRWFGVSVFPVGHFFSSSKPLNRIVMMKKSSTSSMKKLFSLLAVPGVCLFMWAFAEPQVIAVTTPAGTPDSLVSVGTATSKNSDGVESVRKKEVVTFAYSAKTASVTKAGAKPTAGARDSITGVRIENSATPGGLVSVRKEVKKTERASADKTPVSVPITVTVNNADKQPLKDVRIVCTEAGKPAVTVTTDKEGKAGLTAGASVNLKVSAKGYQEMDVDIKNSAGVSSAVFFVLNKQ